MSLIVTVFCQTQLVFNISLLYNPDLPNKVFQGDIGRLLAAVAQWQNTNLAKLRSWGQVQPTLLSSGERKVHKVDDELNGTAHCA